MSSVLDSLFREEYDFVPGATVGGRSGRRCRLTIGKKEVPLESGVSRLTMPSMGRCERTAGLGLAWFHLSGM